MQNVYFRCCLNVHFRTIFKRLKCPNPLLVLIFGLQHFASSFQTCVMPFCSPAIKKINSFQKNACISLAVASLHYRFWLCNFVKGRPEKEIERKNNSRKATNSGGGWSRFDSEGGVGEVLQVQGRHLRKEFCWGCSGLCHSLELAWVQQ